MAAAAFYSARQVAQRLGIHVRTVHRYIREGRLDAVKMGNRYRVSPESLTDFVGDTETAALRTAPRPEASAAVELWTVTGDRVEQLSALVLGAASARVRDAGDLRVDVAYEPDDGHVRVVVQGALPHVIAVLALVSALVEP